MLIEVPKWLIERTFTLNLCNKRFQTIWVESPNLTASYYREYLGFWVILRKGNHQKMVILLYRQGNWIWLKAIEFNKHIKTDYCQTQRITIHTRNIETEYTKLSEKARFVKPIDHKNNEKKWFAIKDCNGNEIIYTA